jgi:hypothetical protein
MQVYCHAQPLRRLVWMSANEEPERKAYANAISAVGINARLPQNVFVGAWNRFLFFEESLIFEDLSIAILHEILDAEGAHSICVANLGNAEVYDPPPARYVGRTTDAPGYISLLRGNGGPDAWLYLRDRYTFASDVGTWCIYCERQEDMGILAIRDAHAVHRFSNVIDKLHAKPIKALSRGSKIGELKFEKLLPVWRSALSKHYAK